MTQPPHGSAAVQEPSASPSPSPNDGAVPNPAARTRGRFLLRVVAVPALVLVAGLALAWREYRTSVEAGPMRPVTPADFAPARNPRPLMFVELVGFPDGNTVVDPVGEGATLVYFPVREPPGRAEDSARVVVAVWAEEAARYLSHDRATGAVGVRGIAQRGIEPRIREALGREGVPLAAAAWVVRPDAHPARIRAGARLIALASAAGALLVLAILWFHWRRSAR